MKNALLTILATTALATTAIAQQETFYGAGNKIMDPCGEQFIPRGINYPVLDDWDFPGNMNTGAEQSIEIVKASPNLVRIAWYNDYGQAARPAFAISDLDSVISRFRRRGIVSVINLMDMTCSDDYNLFSTRVPTFWTKPEVVALLNKHKGMVMANIANEFGQVDWANDPNTAFTKWKDNYKTTITAMRNAGIKVPIMVDGPDCGTNLDRLLSAGAEFQSHDPNHNIICSIHAYWGTDDSATVANKVKQIAAAAFPVIMGEIANWQTDDIPCKYNIKLTSILRQAQADQIGWMSWCWYKDHCPSRQLTNNGMFNNLSPYGQLIINDPNWGLATKAKKTAYLNNGGYCFPTDVKQTAQQGSAYDWNQPLHTLYFKETGQFSITNMAGSIVATAQANANTSYTTDATLPAGVYIIRFVNTSGQPSHNRVFIGNN